MRIQNKKNWKKHVPGKARRASRDYYAGHAKKSKIRLRRIILVIFILLLIQSIFQIKLFRLTDIRLVNNEDLFLENIQDLVYQHINQRRYFIFKNNNYFLFDQTALVTDLKKQYNLDQVIITKSFPHSIEIKVQEKISRFIWQKDDTLYLLDNQGILNRQIGEIDEKYLILHDFRNIQPSGGQILSNNELDIVNDIYLSWQEIFSSQQPILQTINLTDDLTTIEAQVKLGYKVKIDSTKDIKEQLYNLKKNTSW